MPQHVPEETRAFRVAAIPAAHDYVRAVTAEARASGRLVLLDDPQPAAAPAGQWWPPVMLDAHWITENAPTFDLLHVHFGIESFSAAQLTDAMDALHAVGRPLVFTVHDLENPQLGDQTQYVRQLSVLVEAADELITLTPGAAREVRQRWGRECTVIAHPQMLGVPAGVSGPVGRRRIGVHLRDLRPNIDAWSIVEALISAADELAREGCPVMVIVDINERVRDDALRNRLRRLVDSSPHAEWIEHPRYSDDELAASIGALDVEVLPYRHGTHSGWLELCWDLGVDLLTPDVGFYREQHDDASVGVFGVGSAPAGSAAAGSAPSFESAPSFGSALRALLARPRENREVLRRRRQDARVAAAHTINADQLAVYERALARVHA